VAVDARLPVSVLTGFLGSGKTTLLNRLLREPGMEGTAVVINEFGEMPLDQHFIEHGDGEVVVMANGCLCCSVQDDLEGVMGRLFGRRAGGQVPAFERMLIETSGLADPAPIMQMLLSQPLVVDNFRLDSVVTTVDVLHAAQQIPAHDEAFKQVALADRLVLTKTDLAPEGLEAVTQRLRSLNAHAPIVPVDTVDSEALFGRSAQAPSQWLGHAHESQPDQPVKSVSLRSEHALPWQPLNRWLTAVRIRYGERLLRLKGIVELEGQAAPVALHGVHHLFHPPVALLHLSGSFRGATLVCIIHGDGDAIAASWRGFLEDQTKEAARP
jgi:G3E family GTPase